MQDIFEIGLKFITRSLSPHLNIRTIQLSFHGNVADFLDINNNTKVQSKLIDSASIVQPRHCLGFLTYECIYVAHIVESKKCVQLVCFFVIRQFCFICSVKINICIFVTIVAFLGARFGVIVVKIALINILTNFRVEPSKDTALKMEYDALMITLSPRKGVRVRFTKI